MENFAGSWKKFRGCVILTFEPQPAGPTFARSALRGAHAGPNRSYGDIHIYKYIYQESQICTISYCARFARKLYHIAGIFRGGGGGVKFSWIWKFCGFMEKISWLRVCVY